MSRSAREYLQHILDETEYLLTHSRELTKEQFLTDATLKRAFVRSIEIIGEAVKQLSEDLRNRHPTIDWRSIALMRDYVIHHYFGVDYDIVWDVVSEHIPLLATEVERMLRSE